MKNKYFFRNRPRFWKSEKIRWTGTIIAVILLITVFTVQNQDIWQNGNLSEEDNMDIGENGEVAVPSVPDILPEPPVVSEEENENETETENPGNASITAVNEIEAEEEAAAVSTPPADWLAPSSGNFGRGFGYNYDPTYEDYRFHNGVDMPLEMGELVLAIADGKVIKAVSDSKWNGRVEIEHTGGLVSVYLGIVPSGIKEGDEIQGGETVGTVGPAPLAEAADGPHLHLEMLLEDQYVDPLEYLR